MEPFVIYKKTLSDRGEVYLRIKARPGASTTAIKGVLAGADGETLKLDIAAAPEKGRANEELVRFLSKEFEVSKNEVSIISGAGDKIKLVKIIIQH